MSDPTPSWSLGSFEALLKEAHFVFGDEGESPILIDGANVYITPRTSLESIASCETPTLSPPSTFAIRTLNASSNDVRKSVTRGMYAFLHFFCTAPHHTLFVFLTA